MRTRSPIRNLGVPPPSWPYNRCHTLSWLVPFTSDGAIPILRWYVLLYDRTKSCRTSRYRTDWFFVKYRHIRVFRVMLNLSTMLAFVSSLCVEKWCTQYCFSNFCNDLFKNSEPLSVCNVIGGLSRSNCVKAATNDAADLFFNGMHQARFENTSITVRRNVVPSLDFFNRDMSTRSACHCWFGPPTTTQWRLKWRLTGLWSVYASCSDSHCSTFFSETTFLNAETPR